MFTPDKVSVPLPALVNAPVPWTTPDNVLLLPCVSKVLALLALLDKLTVRAEVKLPPNCSVAAFEFEPTVTAFALLPKPLSALINTVPLSMLVPAV